MQYLIGYSRKTATGKILTVSIFTVFVLLLSYYLFFSRISTEEDLKPRSKEIIEESVDNKVVVWIEDKYGKSAINRIADWRELITHNRELDEQSQLELVNDFFNQTPYSTDAKIWGRGDYWTTPIEMLSINTADCEDYSIAKYFTLREMGIPAEKLRITYVKALELNQAHMVLAYYAHHNAKPLVLDNLIGWIRPATERQDLVPIYSFNGEWLWLAKSGGSGKRVGRSERITLWKDLTTKMEKEHGVISM